jgi:hypothetical protein
MDQPRNAEGLLFRCRSKHRLLDRLAFKNIRREVDVWDPLPIDANA